MRKINKKIAIPLLLATLVTSLTGCSLPFGNKQAEEENVVYEKIALTADQLEAGKLYVKDGASFYECPKGTNNWEGERNAKVYVDKVDESRVLMFGDDDVLIPTLYKDLELVYVTSVNPQEIYWERYEDEGYTIGAIGLTESVTGKYQVDIIGKNFLNNSSMKNAILATGKLGAEDQIIVTKVSSTDITSGYISRAGSILGLQEDMAYSVDVYKGSEYYPLTNVIADTHVFCNFEVQVSTDFDYIATDYIVVNVPNSILSGYYYLNGIGFFKYVNGSAADGDANVNFNTPYYYVDENGNELTYYDLPENMQSSTTDPEAGNVDNSGKADHTNTFYLDCSNKNMLASISYGPITTVVDGKEINLDDGSSGTPSAVLTSPNGLEYNFLLDPATSTLSCEVANPMTGEWTVSVYNAHNRRISFFTELKSGHSDVLYHEGDGEQKMTYYISDHMSNGIILITWENKSRAAEIKIETPDGSKYNSEEDTDVIYDEGYGFVRFNLGELNAGDYEITIKGSDLYRVRVQSEDLALSADGLPTISIDNN